MDLTRDFGPRARARPEVLHLGSDLARRMAWQSSIFRVRESPRSLRLLMPVPVVSSACGTAWVTAIRARHRPPPSNGPVAASCQ
jgi:hypothetical protein